METRAHHVLIGLFTILSVAAALVFTLWLGNSGHDRQYALYDIVFREPVSGLSRGSAVEFNGIRIGDVSSLRLDIEDPRRVFARVRVEASAPIRSDTQARLVMAGITGQSIIRLSSGNESGATQLLPSSEDVPIIYAQPSPMSRLLADGEDVMMQVNEVLVRARELLSSENTERISATLDNLQTFSSTLTEQREALTTTLEEASKLMQSARGLVDDELRQTLTGTQRSVEAFERAMSSIEGIVAENRGNVDSGMRGLADVGPAVAELRGTLASLRGILNEFEESPREYLLGRQPTREYQP